MKRQIINIERASEETINQLLKLGILYVGEDNQIHVADADKREEK
jgi:hypothetical protein